MGASFVKVQSIQISAQPRAHFVDASEKELPRVMPGVDELSLYGRYVLACS